MALHTAARRTVDRGNATNYTRRTRTREPRRTRKAVKLNYRGGTSNKPHRTHQLHTRDAIRHFSFPHFRGFARAGAISKKNGIYRVLQSPVRSHTPSPSTKTSSPSTHRTTTRTTALTDSPTMHQSHTHTHTHFRHCRFHHEEANRASSVRALPPTPHLHVPATGRITCTRTTRTRVRVIPEVCSRC